MINRLDVNINSTNINKKATPQISFGEGKVEVYSDFDRTFLPARQKGIANLGHASEATKLIEYFDSFRQFLDKTREGIAFKITTGRNFHEFEHFADTIRSKGFKMPLPVCLITSNGGDEFAKISSNEEYHNGGKLPFSFEHPNQAKRDDMKRLYNWDGSKLRVKIEDILKEHGLEIKTPLITNSPSDYGDKSLFHSFSDDFNPKNPNGSPNSPWVASIRQDGDLNICVSYPKDYRYAQDRFDAVEDIRTKIGDFIKEKDMSIGIKSHDRDGDCGHRPTMNYYPYVLSKEGKLYDTKKAVEKAAKNNDLVIVAGDSSNDVKMLNPMNYLDESLDEELWKALDVPEFVEDLMAKNPKLAEAYQKLPLIGIVVKNKDKSNGDLNSFVKHYGQGEHRKIIEVEEGHLHEGIQEAIRVYSSQNPEYAKKLSPDIKKTLGMAVETSPVIGEETKGNTEVKDNKEHVTRSTTGEKPNSKTKTATTIENETKTAIKESKCNKKVALIASGIALVAGIGAYLYFSSKKKKEAEQPALNIKTQQPEQIPQQNSQNQQNFNNITLSKENSEVYKNFIKSH